MFEPSHKALIHLCNALKALEDWHSLLQRFGLADPVGWGDALSMGEPELVPDEFWSWDSLLGTVTK